MQLWKRPLAPLGVSRPHTLRGQLKGVPGLGLEPQLPNVTMEDRNAQDSDLCKVAHQSGKMRRDGPKPLSIVTRDTAAQLSHYQIRFRLMPAPEFESTLPMFFFDWNFFAQLCGASSLNAVILPKEIRLPQKQGGNEFLAKDLREFIAWEDLSRKRVFRLINTYREHFSVRGGRLNNETIARFQEVAEMIISDEPGQVPLSDVRKAMWDSFPENFPPKTFDHFCELVVSSLSMHSRIEKEGPSSLLRKLNELDDPTWDPFFVEMARRLKGANEVPKDVSAALQIWGCLSLFLTFWFEALGREKATPAEQEQAIRDSVNLLFAMENEQAYPQKSVARLLKKSFDHSGCETKTDFIKMAFGASGPHIREIHKFFAGTEIPTFEQARSMLRASSLSASDNPEEDDLLVMIFQFISRSYRHLNERLDEPLPDELKPHAIFFKQLNGATQDRPDGDPASLNSSD